MMPLLSAGFSLLVYNLAALMLLTVDRIVLANVMPLDEFGQYNFASSVFTAVLLIPGSIGLVMYTFILRTAGNDGGRRALPTIVYKSNGVLAVTTPLLLASVTLMGAEVIMRWLPQYAPALRVIHLMTVGLYFYVIPMNSIHALLALDRQKTLIVAALCGVMINILCTVGLFMVGYGMLGAAWGLIMGLAVFSVSSLVAVYKQFNLPSRSIVIKILMDFLPLAIYVVALYAVTLFNLGEGTGFHKSLVVYMAFSMPFLGFGYVYLRKYVRIDPSVMVRTWWQSRMVRENL
jgi:O-antigen/teichoic acid export membrane protein